jgi:lysophospholipase L1-like esterase
VKRGLISSVWILIGTVATAQEPAVCNRTTEPMTIDGALDENPWRRAKPIEFVIPVSHDAPQSHAVGRMLWDDENLYVAFESTDTELKGDHTRRDSATFRDDVCEIFFQPSVDAEDYHNLEINVLGTVHDQHNGQSAWDCEGLEIAVATDGTVNDNSDTDEGWTLEVAIPFASLSDAGVEPPSEGDEWAFHLARYDYAANLPDGVELSSSAPLTRVNFHHRPDWGTVRFAAASLPGDLEEEVPLRWVDALELGLEGQGFGDVAHPYDRLPGRAEADVREIIWTLAQHSAGLSVHFVTDSPRIAARWTVTNENLAMNHMPATGVSGIDLYAREDNGNWRWAAVGRPRQPTNEANLISSAPSGEHESMLYLPLYNGVTSVEIGILEEASIARASARPGGREKPILFYGTSITQGGCASRPGMSYPAILGRHLQWATINLGFSGSAHMEPEMATLLAELDPVVYVLDSAPNMTGEMIDERTVNFVKMLRSAHPETPIVMVEHVGYQGITGYRGPWLPDSEPSAVRDNIEAWNRAYANLIADGVENLHHIGGEGLIGTDSEATVDGIHFTDLGFTRMAAGLEPTLRELLPAD